MTATQAAILFGVVAAAVMLGLVFLRGSKDTSAQSVCACQSKDADEGTYHSEGPVHKPSAGRHREHVER